MIKALVFLSLALMFFGCASNSVSQRDPSSDAVWNLSGIALNTKAISGACDLTPTHEIRRSSLLSTTSVVGNLDANKCRFKGSSVSVTSSALFRATYMVSRPNVISFQVKIGDLDYAKTEKDDKTLSSQGYEDVHVTGQGVYKFKTTSTINLEGTCREPTLVGLYEFRKTMVSCTFAGGAGTISLIQD